MKKNIKPKSKARLSLAARKRAMASGTSDLSPAGSKIVAALEEAIGTMRSVGPERPRLTVRTYRLDFTPTMYGPADVRRVRDLLGMSQAVFAGFLGVGPSTVRSWEQGIRPPQQIARRFLAEIEAAPEHWRQRLTMSLAGAESS